MPFGKIGFQNYFYKILVIWKKNLKLDLPPWFYKNHFYFENHFFNFHIFFVKSINIKSLLKPIISWVFEFLPLIRPNHALCAFIATSKLQFHIFDSKGKIIQNIKFFHVSPNNYLTFKIKPYSSTRVHGYARFLKQNPRYEVIKISHKLRQ